MSEDRGQNSGLKFRALAIMTKISIRSICILTIKLYQESIVNVIVPKVAKIVIIMEIVIIMIIEIVIIMIQVTLIMPSLAVKKSPGVSLGPTNSLRFV